MKLLNKIKAWSKYKTLHLLNVEIIAGKLTSILSTILFFRLTDSVFENESVTIDNLLLISIYHTRTPFLTTLMKAFSFVGRDVVILFAIFIPLLFYYKKRKRETLLFSIMIGMGAVIDVILKNVTQRQRPNLSPLVVEKSFSYPSGHSMNSFIFFMTLAYFFYHFTHKKKSSLIMFIFASIIIFCIGFSRVYLGVHYPTDVIGGYLAGFIWMVSVLLIDKTLQLLKGVNVT